MAHRQFSAGALDSGEGARHRLALAARQRRLGSQQGALAGCSPGVVGTGWQSLPRLGLAARLSGSQRGAVKKGHCAPQRNAPANVRTGSDCEVTACRRHVRFTLNIRHFEVRSALCPWARGGHSPLVDHRALALSPSPGFAFSYAVSPIASRRPALIKFRNSGSYTDAAAEAASGRSCLSRSKI